MSYIETVCGSINPSNLGITEEQILKIILENPKEILSL